MQKFDYSYGQINTSGNPDASKNNGQLAQIEAFIGAAKQRTQKFTYDSIGRLSKSEEYRGDTNALSYNQVFDYDRFGNLYRKAASNPTTDQQNPLPTNWIEDEQIDKSKNQFLSWTGVTYDEAGQVTTDNKFRSMGFAYDANGRLVKATKANTPDATTVYDALGNRVATKINDVWQYMIYDAFGQLVAEYGVPSQGIGGVKFVQQDHQGSVRTVTDAHGNIVSRSDYQAFGDEVGAGIGLRTAQQGYGADSVARQGYGLTEKDDSSGQQHTWFRKLETQAGRWSSPDPYNGSMSIDDPQSFNRYGYVGNEPTNRLDPSGLAWRLECVWSWTINEDGSYSDYSGGCDSVWSSEWRWQGYNGQGHYDTIVDPGAGITVQYPGSGGGQQGECERIVAKIEQLINDFDETFRKYDPVRDFYGGDLYKRGGQVRITKPGTHYDNLTRIQNGLKKRLEAWKNTCNDRFGGPPLVPVPAEASERATRPIMQPHPRSVWDILPKPPTTEQLRKTLPWSRSFPTIPPIIPVPVPVTP